MTGHQEELVSNFLEITECNCRDLALNILEDVGWNIEAAIQSFFEDYNAQNESVESTSEHFLNYDYIVPTGCGLVDDEADDNFDTATEHTDLGPEEEIEVDERQEHLDIVSNIEPMSESDSLDEESRETNLPILYRPPTYTMYGNFHEVKVEASDCDQWLLVNVQSSQQFDSHMMDRDIWANESIRVILSSHFVFWQVSYDAIEGQKVCCFYKLRSLPATLVIDPITGEKMYACVGRKQPEDLFKDLMSFVDRSPKQIHDSRAQRGNASASTHQTDKASHSEETSPVSITYPTYPPLPEEPTEKQLICKVRICLPNGHRVQRSFLKTDSTKFLWSFCSALLDEEESKKFCFLVPSSPKLSYEEDKSFEEAGLSSALLRLRFEDDN